MPSKRPNQQDLANRVDGLAALLSALEEELLHLQEEGEVAPIGSWITRYQARGHTKRYWYYKWQAIDPVFPTRAGKLSRYKHLGKAGSPAYLEAVSQLVRRDKIEGLGQAIKTLKAGLADSVDHKVSFREASF